MGYFASTITPSFHGGIFPVDIWVNDLLLDTVTIEVIGPEASQTPHHVSWPEEPDAGVNPTADGVVADERPVTGKPSDGCGSGATQSSPAGLLGLVLAGLALYARRRNRTQPIPPSSPAR